MSKPPFWKIYDARQKLNELITSAQVGPVHMGGIPTHPQYLWTKSTPTTSDFELSLAVESLKADWTNVLLAIGIYGARVRVHSRKLNIAAILQRYPGWQHPVLEYAQYRRSDA